MSLFALITWIMTAGGGLYLLSIWLIEYDKDFQSAAATRLPPVVLSSHVLLAFGGLIVWAGYLVFDIDGLTWVAVGALGGAASLGAVMAIRWVGVYRAGRAADIERQVAERVALAVGDAQGQVAVVERPLTLEPPERNFPLPVVVAHGFFALITITLVVLTACGVGGS
jgi:hypothetical protein